MADQLIITQKVELVEGFTGFESANKYKVLNRLGQEVSMPRRTPTAASDNSVVL